MLENMLVVYLVLVNIAAFGMYGMDKQKAIRKQWRIPEAQLLAVAVIGGSAGALLGMQFFHHKTRKWKFRLGVPLILAVQLNCGEFCSRRWIICFQNEFPVENRTDCPVLNGY